MHLGFVSAIFGCLEAGEVVALGVVLLGGRVDMREAQHGDLGRHTAEVSQRHKRWAARSARAHAPSAVFVCPLEGGWRGGGVGSERRGACWIGKMAGSSTVASETWLPAVRFEKALPKCTSKSPNAHDPAHRRGGGKWRPHTRRRLTREEE